MLVSRIATLGKLQHQAKGYRGPLSRHLLAYRSIVSALQSTLRDLLEINLATLFLKGHVDRDRSDWMDLALGYVARKIVKDGTQSLTNSGFLCMKIILALLE